MDRFFDLLPSASVLTNEHPSLERFLQTALLWLAVGLVMEVLLWGLGRWSQRTDNELDDVLVATIRPPLWATILFVALLDLARPWLADPAAPAYAPARLVEILGRVGVLLSLLWLLYRTLTRVVLRLAEQTSRSTETRFDDLVLPILNKLVRPLVVVVGALFVMDALSLPVQSIALITAGASFVLAFAFKDVLSDIYSGIALLLDTPFGQGDIIETGEGERYEVLSLGLRVTRLYDPQHHNLVVMPNRRLTDDKLVNASRPSPDMRIRVEVRVAEDSDTRRVEDRMREAALAHPWILGDIEAKLPALRRRVDRLVWLGHVELAARSLREGVRLRAEADVNALVDALARDLARWSSRVHVLEDEGHFSPEQRREVEGMLDRVEGHVEEIRVALAVWLMATRLSYVEGLDLSLDVAQHQALLAEVHAVPGYGPPLDEAQLRAVHGLVERAFSPIQRRLEVYEAQIRRWAAGALAGDPDGLDILLPGGGQSPRHLFQALQVQEHRFGDAGYGAGLADGARKGIADLDDAEELVDLYRTWCLKTRALEQRVAQLRAEYQSGVQRHVDERMYELRHWLSSDFKETAPHWKQPSVALLDMDDGLRFELKAYVDNVKLSHFTRASKTRKQLQLAVLRLLRDVAPVVELAVDDVRVEVVGEGRQAGPRSDVEGAGPASRPIR